MVSRFLSVFVLSSAPDHLWVATSAEKEFVMATSRGRPVGINAGKEVDTSKGKLSDSKVGEGIGFRGVNMVHLFLE